MLVGRPLNGARRDARAAFNANFEWCGVASCAQRPSQGGCEGSAVERAGYVKKLMTFNGNVGLESKLLQLEGSPKSRANRPTDQTV